MKKTLLSNLEDLKKSCEEINYENLTCYILVLEKLSFIQDIIINKLNKIKQKTDTAKEKRMVEIVKDFYIVTHMYYDIETLENKDTYKELLNSHYKEIANALESIKQKFIANIID